MQTNRTPLPTVCLSSRLQREENLISGIVSSGNKELSKSAAFLLSNKKQLHPLNGGPYNSSNQFYMQPIQFKQCSKSLFVQKVVSAKMLRIKTLQNQLTDAHYHLNELANENKLLKTLQKRQDSALRQYEGTNAELPMIINTHHEELRVLQSKYKKLRTQNKSNCELLKQKEIEMNVIQYQNKHLLQLSKDRNLEEREGLQRRVSDLNYKIEQQDKTINTLNRKLAIETKHLKHQIQIEVMKHKETQKRLQETLKQLKYVEEVTGNKVKTLLHGKELNLASTRQNIKRISHPNLHDNSSGINFETFSSKHNKVKAENQDNTQTNVINENNNGKCEVNLCSSEKNKSSFTVTSKPMSSLQGLLNFRLNQSWEDKSFLLDHNNGEAHSDVMQEQIFYKKNDDNLRSVLQDGAAFHSHELQSRLRSHGEENFNTSNSSLINMEKSRDSLIIEDIEKVIEQLQLSEVSSRSDSITSTKLKNKDENHLVVESFVNSQNNIMANVHDIERDENVYTMHYTDLNYKIDDSKVLICTTSDSVNSLENRDSMTPQKKRLRIKYSISEESEPEAFAEVSGENRIDISTAVHTESENKETLVLKKKINYDKERLLAAMKAIDDNENIEFSLKTSPLS